MYYIYVLKEDNQIKYVGQTINPLKRKCSHRNTKEPHVFEIIFETNDKKIAKQKEIEYILKFNTYLNGWNKSPGGEGFDCYERKGIGGVKKGNIPWNKNKIGCFNEETLNHFSKIRKGKVWKPPKLTESDIKNIREIYNKNIQISGVGMKMKNGKTMSYIQAFSIKYSKVYDTTKENIRRIIEKKTWKNV